MTAYNDLSARRTQEELLLFLAYWTQQLLIELRHLRQTAGVPIHLPLDTTLAVNVGLEQARRTPIYLSEADFEAMFRLRAAQAKVIPIREVPTTPQ